MPSNRRARRTISGGGGFVFPLVTISLSASSLPENSSENTVVGQVTVTPADTQLSLYDNAGNKFKLDGSNRLVAGPTAASASTIPVTVRGSWAGAVTDVVLNITVTAVPVTNIDVVNTQNAPSNSTAGTFVTGFLSTPAGATFSIVTQTVANAFAIVGNNLVIGSSPPNKAVNAAINVTIRATKGAQTYDKVFTFSIV